MLVKYELNCRSTREQLTLALLLEYSTLPSTPDMVHLTFFLVRLINIIDGVEFRVHPWHILACRCSEVIIELEGTSMNTWGLLLCDCRFRFTPDARFVLVCRRLYNFYVCDHTGHFCSS